MADANERGLTWVGAPIELIRVVDSVYLDQARFDFDRYVTLTLTYSQRVGGRFNPPGEFGVLYTAMEERTAWAEVAHRFQREGIDGLPAAMGVLRLIVRSGQYADLTKPEGCEAWEIEEVALTADPPTAVQREDCWRVSRSVRVIGDALRVNSACVTGENMPLFPDRIDSELQIGLQSAETRRVPDEYVQRGDEAW